jgi:hypothetical protein
LQLGESQPDSASNGFQYAGSGIAVFIMVWGILLPVGLHSGWLPVGVVRGRGLLLSIFHYDDNTQKIINQGLNDNQGTAGVLLTVSSCK